MPTLKGIQVKHQVGNADKTSEMWEDLGLGKGWTDKRGEGEEDIDIDNVHELFSNYDLT